MSFYMDEMQSMFQRRPQNWPAVHGMQEQEQFSSSNFGQELRRIPEGMQNQFSHFDNDRQNYCDTCEDSSW